MGADDFLQADTKTFVPLLIELMPRQNGLNSHIEPTQGGVFRSVWAAKLGGLQERWVHGYYRLLPPLETHRPTAFCREVATR